MACWLTLWLSIYHPQVFYMISWFRYVASSLPRDPMENCAEIYGLNAWNHSQLMNVNKFVSENFPFFLHCTSVEWNIDASLEPTHRNFIMVFYFFLRLHAINDTTFRLVLDFNRKVISMMMATEPFDVSDDNKKRLKRLFCSFLCRRSTCIVMMPKRLTTVAAENSSADKKHERKIA